MEAKRASGNGGAVYGDQMNADQIEAGPELDWKIGLAIQGPLGFVPPYSTDWNAAMQAAEKFLTSIDGRFCFRVERFTDCWKVSHDNFVLEIAPTGPLAICRAILTLNSRQ